MTTPSQPPGDNLPRDPAFDDAWRALSREEPPAALDAALRAAARREVGAGPQPAAGHGNAGARTPKAMNWWRPLAVAATLGAIAVGLLQLVTPERIGAPGRDGAIVSDMPAAGEARQQTEKKKADASAANEVAAPADRAQAFPAPGTPVSSNADRKETPVQPAETAVPAAKPASAERQAPAMVHRDIMAERRREAERANAPASPAPPIPPQSAEPASAAATNVAPMRAAEPFPAEARKREMAKDALAARPPPSPAAAGGIASRASEAVTAPPTAPLAKLQAAPAPAAPESAVRPSVPAQESVAQGAAAPPRAKVEEQTAAATGRADTRYAAHGVLSVPDWIALIRRLIAERNFAAAEKELAAFRAAHADADRVLPPDLRDWKAPR